jgi:hypothetical protein
MNIDEVIQKIIDNQINKDFVFAGLDVLEGIPRDVYIQAKETLKHSGTLEFVSQGTYRFYPEWKTYFQNHTWEDFKKEIDF